MCSVFCSMELYAINGYSLCGTFYIYIVIMNHLDKRGWCHSDISYITYKVCLISHIEGILMMMISIDNGFIVDK